jgi:hypothetical protein
MTRVGYTECLSWAEVAGSALTSTAAASLLPPPAVYTAPASQFWDVGKKLKMEASGIVSNIVTTPGTLTLSVQMPSGTSLTSLGAIPLNVVAKTNVSWDLQLWISCRSIGNSTNATLWVQGRFESESVQGATAGFPLACSLPASGAAASTGFNSTGAITVDLYGIFSLTGNSMTLEQYSLYAEN